MKNLTRIGAMGMLLVSFLHAAAQQQSRTVHLTVIHDGRPRPAPHQIKLSFGDHSLRIPVREGKFEVPAEFVAARRVTFETDVEDSHIRLTKIAGADFTEENWTLRLAERADDDYEWPGPKGANIPASCMLEFDSANEEPERGHFEEHCRSKKK